MISKLEKLSVYDFGDKAAFVAKVMNKSYNFADLYQGAHFESEDVEIIYWIDTTGEKDKEYVKINYKGEPLISACLNCNEHDTSPIENSEATNILLGLYEKAQEEFIWRDSLTL